MSKPSRFVFLDLLRAIAAQLIVLHHLAFYGPLSDTAYDLAPGRHRLALQLRALCGAGVLRAERVLPGDGAAVPPSARRLARDASGDHRSLFAHWPAVPGGARPRPWWPTRSPPLI